MVQKVVTWGRTDHHSNIRFDFGWLLLTYSFQFMSAFQTRSATSAVAELSFTYPACDNELWPMTLTFEHDLDRVKMNSIPAI